jgi:hypothetical protein
MSRRPVEPKRSHHIICWMEKRITWRISNPNILTSMEIRNDPTIRNHEKSNLSIIEHIGLTNIHHRLRSRTRSAEEDLGKSHMTIVRWIIFMRSCVKESRRFNRRRREFRVRNSECRFKRRSFKRSEFTSERYFASESSRAANSEKANQVAPF